MVRHWDHPTRDLAPAVHFFKYDTTYLQNFGSSPPGLKAKQEEIEVELQAASVRRDQPAVDARLADRAVLQGRHSSR